MNVLLLGNSDSGLYDFRKELLLGLMEQGYTVHVSVPDTGYLEKIRALGCVCHETAMERRGMNPAKDLKLFAFYRRLFKRVKPAAVLTYTIKPNIYGGMACRLGGIPYLANITGLGTALEGGGALQKMLVRMYREALKKAGCVFFQNRRNLEFMKEKGCIGPDAPTRLVAGSGVNLKEHGQLPYPAEQPVIFVSVIRIMKEKGIEELLEAAQAIHREYRGVRFQILGAYEEDCRGKYQPLLEELEKQGILEYYGYRDDVQDFLEGCQAVIHPSYSEGISNVLLEAAAAGRPVLASDISGCRETFEDGISGIAFAPRSAAGLADAIRAFLAMNYESRRRMGLEGRAYVARNFDRKEVVRAYLDTLAKLAEDGRPSR